VPLDIQGEYSTKRISFSLRTRNKRTALLGASHLASELDSHWSGIRIRKMVNKHIHCYTRKIDVTLVGTSMSEALEYYLKIKGQAKPELFHKVATRNINFIIAELGDRDLAEYMSSDAGKFRDSLLDRGLLTSSVKRIFSSIKSVVNFSIKENGMNIVNPFLGVYIPDLNDTTKRKSIPIETIQKIQDKCVSTDDELRWMIGIISDTGMRLAEAVGLIRKDIVLNCDIPHVIIRPNEKRRLKTKQSERTVPLVGVSLWAATRIIESTNDEQQYVFKRYNKTKTSNANSASAALNKWIKPYVENDMVIHSFRHAMRDRLRSVECPSDVVDSIGGWSAGSIGASYGTGYTLNVLHKWMSKMVQD
jgi:integrase